MAFSEASTITSLLFAWQSQGDPDDFESLARAIGPLVEKRAATILKRAGIRSLPAIDEVVSLVFDHLRRLHRGAKNEPPVTPFAPPSSNADDAGRRYVIWLTQGRTHDLVRSERRRSRVRPTFSELWPRHRDDRIAATLVPGSIAPVFDSDPHEAVSMPANSLLGCIASLPPDQQRLIEMLLADIPQKTIARSLGISEGTLSRRKARAFAALREHLGEARRCGFEQPTKPVVGDSVRGRAAADIGLDGDAPSWPGDSRGFTSYAIKTLCDYVDSRLAHPFRLRSLAALVGLSPGHFHRKFRLSFGLSPSDFVRERRVREAARLLKSSGLPLAEIARRVGFLSQSHLTQVFRSVMGTTPAGFRSEQS
jgi:RNA polymerase sigma factor (sigma-70 family)